MWPNARIAVMGGEQAANVLATVTRDKYAALGKEWPKEEEEKLLYGIQKKFELESSAYYSSARGWDDGVIAPADSRTVIAQSLAIGVHGWEKQDTQFPVFRM